MLHKGVGFIIFLWLAASMSAPAYAGLGLMLALQTGITTFASAGVVDSLLGRIKHSHESEVQQRYFVATMDVFWALAVIVLAMVAALSGPITHLTGASWQTLAAVMITGVLSAFFLVQAYLIRLQERHQAAILVGTIPPLAGLIVGIALYLAQQTISSFFLGSAIVMAASLPALSRLYVGWGGPSLHKKESQQIAKSMPPFMVVALLAWVIGYGSTFLINIFFTENEGARFTFAYTLASVLQLLATSLNQVWAPRFFKQVHVVPLAEIERQNDRFYLLQGAIVGTAGALLIIAIPLAIRLSGISQLEHYQNLNLELFCLLAVYALSINWYHAQNYFLAHGRGGAFMTAVVASTLAGVAIWVLGAWIFGVFGAYLGFVAQALLKGAVTNLWAARRWGIRILWQGPALALAILGLGAVGSHLMSGIG
ncbi:lipopolysaccharide biosynthesis protein [Devosia limi]|uniref:lipopolysaccharide biosynthesis protein n=1 Tax=Devosia limi TaxID=288995 RepID=UPI001AEBD783|nr:oligosaccharide flippase family protein [Devosia limi]